MSRCRSPAPPSPPAPRVSSVKVNDAVPVLPATSVSLATMVCAPCARPLGVNDQAPLAFAVVVPSTVAPSVSVTTALASPRAAQRRVRGDLVARR